MPPTNPPAGHRDRAQAATHHVDEITKLARDLDAHLDAVFEGGPADDADAVLARIIAAAEEARTALRPRLSAVA